MTIEKFKTRIRPEKNSDVNQVDHILLCSAHVFTFPLSMWISGLEKGTSNILVYLPIGYPYNNLFVSTLETVWSDSGFKILSEEKVSNHLGYSIIFKLHK